MDRTALDIDGSWSFCSQTGTAADIHFSPGLHSLWHSFRIPLLLIVAVVFVATKAVVRPRNIPKGGALPNYSAADGKADERRAVDDTLSTNRPRNLAGSALSRLENGLARPPKSPKRVVGNKNARKTRNPPGGTSVERLFEIEVVVFYASVTGSTERYAKRFFAKLSAWLAGADARQQKLTARLVDLSEADYDDHFGSVPPDGRRPAERRLFYLFLIPSYDIDTILNTFLAHLQETHYDFRIDKAPLRALLGYSVFGFGDKENWPTPEDGFCSQARQLDKWMARLTAGRRAFPLGLGDVRSDADERLEEWRLGVEEIVVGVGSNGELGEGVVGSGDAAESEDEDDEDGEDDPLPAAQRRARKKQHGSVDDVEEVGAAATRAAESRTSSGPRRDRPRPTATDAPAKEMVPKTSPTYAALTKQGYTIVGSHSGVKMCRWTKSALRGRGSCYKHSFYGIKSHLCMETTPSLSCSNKCVFCWRHGTNPVGTVWRWQVDPPEMILDGAKQGHYRKIRMMRGVPGVLADRFADALRIRHCALSLVGEPIFYPRINELLALLHRERISTFVVCNAQHPAQLEQLDRVTQLYVSIDASNRESLRRIDRPLHRDFWERFLSCLDILRARRFAQRTVFRLTLVKGFNVEDEVAGYADLIVRAMPCFVEIKGVTFCGTTSSSNSKAGAALTMSNVPFHSEVAQFAVALNDAVEQRLGRGRDSSSTLSSPLSSSSSSSSSTDSTPLEDNEGYGIAAEHSHSCCILLASKRFLIDGRWHTRIDYEQFFNLLCSRPTASSSHCPSDLQSLHSSSSNHLASAPASTPASTSACATVSSKPRSFRPEEYMDATPTPDWALFGNGGFDPADTRVWTKGKKNKGNHVEEGRGA